MIRVCGTFIKQGMSSMCRAYLKPNIDSEFKVQLPINQCRSLKRKWYLDGKRKKWFACRFWEVKKVTQEN
jgi:hypothetical protein